MKFLQRIFGRSLAAHIKDLNFQSESDGIWRIWDIEEDRERITVQVMKKLTGSQRVEAINFAKFFDHHSSPAVQPQWERYIKLRIYFDEHFVCNKVFRCDGIKHYNMTYYVVGIDRRANIRGIYVGATET